MTSAGETYALKWSKDRRKWCLVLVAKPDIEKEDMNAADECNDALEAQTTPSQTVLGRPIAKLNQMGQYTCYLKRSGGPPHQISAILPVLQKEGCMDHPTETTALT